MFHFNPQERALKSSFSLATRASFFKFVAFSDPILNAIAIASAKNLSFFVGFGQIIWPIVFVYLPFENTSSKRWGRDVFDARKGARMERRPASSVGLGLTHADALHKLKRDLSDVSEELKTALRGESTGKDDEGGEEAELGDARVGDEDASRIAIVRASPWHISTAIPFDFWSLGLLIVSVVLLLVSQVW